MTQPTPNVIWQATVDGTTWRLVDLGPQAPARWVLQQQQGPNATGEYWWSDVSLPFGAVLESAFTALYRPA